jgi:hypothetical protein
MKSLKRPIARRIARWIAPLERVEPGDIRQNPDGSVTATRAFRSREDARRFARFVALQRNPLGRRAIQWLIRAGQMRPPAAD